MQRIKTFYGPSMNRMKLLKRVDNEKSCQGGMSERGMRGERSAKRTKKTKTVSDLGWECE